MLPQKQQDRKGMFTPYAWSTSAVHQTAKTKRHNKRREGQSCERGARKDSKNGPGAATA